MNHGKITEFEKMINNVYSNIAGIVVLKDGKHYMKVTLMNVMLPAESTFIQ